MNIGVSLIRLGRLDEAEEWLRKAIRIFSRKTDADRLSYAHNNLGITLKLGGKIKEARTSYFHALQLSTICRNVNMRLHILANLATLYEFEGRTRVAIRYHVRAGELARKHGFRVQSSLALINAATQYSILGKYKVAVSKLLNALKLVRALELQFEIASAHESLGLAYFFSKHIRKAVSNLEMAAQYFSKAGADKDRSYLR